MQPECAAMAGTRASGSAGAAAVATARLSSTRQLPRDPAPDSTIALLYTDGYDFIGKRCQQFGSDIFATRIMLQRAVCILGAEAAAEFYHPGRFTRRRALPLFALTLIQDLGSVMVADGEEHRRRKALFLSFMTPEALARLGDLTAHHWRAALTGWHQAGRVRLFDAAHIPLCAAICEWAGLRLTPQEIARRAYDFKVMVDGTGTVGPRNWWGHIMRWRTERWARRLIARIRAGIEPVAKDSPAYAIAFYRDTDGALLDLPVAAVELINVLRPTVANARYVVFAAMALHDHPEWRERLRESDDGLEEFVDEVRRFYPFIPFLGGRVLQPFTWRGHSFKEQDWVLFDIYGTNHDRRIWGDPENFRPLRFRESSFGPFDLVSHGAGDRRVTHRCPGEGITVEQLKTIVRLLVRAMRYEVPAQDLRLSPRRIPALPPDRFLIKGVQPATT